MRFTGRVLRFGRRAGRAASRNQIGVGELLARPENSDRREVPVAQSIDEIL
jgi:hypothetical protein